MIEIPLTAFRLLHKIYICLFWVGADLRLFECQNPVPESQVLMGSFACVEREALPWLWRLG